MGFRQIFTGSAFPLKEIRDRIETEPIYPYSQPKIYELEYGCSDQGTVIIKVRLVGIKTVPVIGVGHRIPGPVGSLKVLENDPCFFVFIPGGAPDIEVPPFTAGLGPAGSLKPRVLVGGMV